MNERIIEDVIKANVIEVLNDADEVAIRLKGGGEKDPAEIIFYAENKEGLKIASCKDFSELKLTHSDKQIILRIDHNGAQIKLINQNKKIIINEEGIVKHEI